MKVYVLVGEFEGCCTESCVNLHKYIVVLRIKKIHVFRYHTITSVGSFPLVHTHKRTDMYNTFFIILRHFSTFVVK